MVSGKNDPDPQTIPAQTWVIATQKDGMGGFQLASHGFWAPYGSRTTFHFKLAFSARQFCSVPSLAMSPVFY